MRRCFRVFLFPLRAVGIFAALVAGILTFRPDHDNRDRLADGECGDRHD